MQTLRFSNAYSFLFRPELEYSPYSRTGVFQTTCVILLANPNNTKEIKYY